MTPEEARAELARRELARRRAAREARQNAPRARGTPGTLVEEVGSTLSMINRGIPVIGQDLVNFGGGVRGILDGSGYQAGVERQRTNSNELQQDFRNRRPNAAAFAEGTGNLSGLLPIGRGAQVVQQGATRGLPLLLGQTRNAAITGAGAGFLYGASTGDAPNMSFEDRLQAGNDAAGAGAALGAATPAAVNLVGGAWQATNPIREAIGRGVNNLPQIAPRAQQGVGSMGGQMFAGARQPPTPPAAPPPQRPRIPGNAMGTIDRMASDARMTPDQVESALAEARRNPQGEALVDVFGDTGVRRFRPIVQSPGQTGNRALSVARRRSQEQPERVVNSLTERLRVSSTPRQALNSLRREYEEVSATGYAPLWQNPMGTQERNALLGRVQTFVDDPAFQAANLRARRIFERDVRLGRAEGNLDGNLPRYLHYVKMGLDAEARWASNPLNNIDATELNQIREMQRRFRSALDDAIPGYREARSQWGGLAEAEDALEEGQVLLNEPAEDVASYMRGLTPFARYHARVGFAHSIAQRVGLRGSVNGNRNVAEALGSPELQSRIRAVFDTPEEAAAFLDMTVPSPTRRNVPQIGEIGPERGEEFLSTLNRQNELARNAQAWGGGSTTWSNAMYGSDEAFNAVADAGLEVARGNPAGAARRAVEGAYNTLRGGVIERANNQRGDALLRRVDTADSEDFARAVVEELRRRDAVRRGASAASQAGGAAGGSQQGRD